MTTTSRVLTFSRARAFLTWKLFKTLYVKKNSLKQGLPFFTRENRSSWGEKEGTQIVTKLSQTVTKGRSFFTKTEKNSWKHCWTHFSRTNVVAFACSTVKRRLTQWLRTGGGRAAKVGRAKKEGHWTAVHSGQQDFKKCSKMFFFRNLF